MGSVQAKAKLKRHHAAAIARFQEWLAEHPNASKKEKTKNFDMFVDSAKLNEELNAS